MLGVKMSFQLGRLKNLTCQRLIANQTKWTVFIVFRYESETVLQKIFLIHSLFGMTCLVFFTNLRFFDEQVGVAFASTAALITSAEGLLLLLFEFFSQLSID